MFEAIVTVVHVLACIFLILIVLLQTGKGAEMGAVFGGSSSTVFGSSGAGNFMTRLTTAMAVIFMLTSLSLTYITSQSRTSTIFDDAPTSSPGAVGEPPAPAIDAPVADVAPLEIPAPAPIDEPAAAPIEEPVAAPVGEPIAAPIDEPAAAPGEEPPPEG